MSDPALLVERERRIYQFLSSGNFSASYYSDLRSLRNEWWACGDVVSSARVGYVLGWLLTQCGENDDAVTALDRCIVDSRRCNNIERLLSAHVLCGVAHAEMSHFDEAQHHFRCVLIHSHQSADFEHWSFRALLNMGITSVDCGDAHSTLSELRLLLSSLENQENTELLQAHCLLALSCGNADLGWFGVAQERLNQAQALYEEWGDRTDILDCAINHTALLVDAGHIPQAISDLKEQLAQPSPLLSTSRERGNLLVNLSAAYLANDQAPEARSAAEVAVKVFRDVAGAERELGDALWNTAVAEALLGDTDQALSDFNQALVFYRSISGAEVDAGDCELQIVLLTAMATHRAEVSVTPDTAGEWFAAIDQIQSLYIRHGADLEWAAAQLARAELAAMVAQSPTGAGFLESAARYAVEAAIVIDHSTFQFANERDRGVWDRFAAEPAWATALDYAFNAGDHDLVTDVVVTARMSGSIAHTAAAKLEAEPSGGTELAASRPEGLYGVLLPVLVRTTGQAPPRVAGPLWVMPDGRVALCAQTSAVDRVTRTPLDFGHRVRYR